MKRAAIVAVSALVSALTAGLTASPAAGDPVIAAAGDIACDPASSSFNGGLGTSTSCRQKYTSDLLVDANLAALVALGDNQYGAELSDYLGSYDPSWGRVKSITRPSPGNHDPWGSSGYDEYFGISRYYAWDIGAWRLYALDSNSVDSTQVDWLTSDLAANPRTCVAAYWHHATFSSGSSHGNDSRTRPFWDALYAANADLVLVAHDHTYERFAPQTPSGQRDDVRGMREFVVGSGGRSHYGFNSPIPNSEVRNGDTFGVLKLTLHADNYDWQFVPEAGKTFTDLGSQACNAGGSPPPSDTQAPSAPTNLTATAPSSTRADLSWGASTDNIGVTGYEIFRSGAPLTTVTGTGYADTTVSPGTTYTYQVRARDAAGNRSAFSNSANVTTPASTTLTLSPMADARVAEAAPTTNYGTSYLRADAGSGVDVESYLRFGLSGISGSVRSAKLRVYAYSATSDGPAVYSTGNAWTEAGITWSNRPGRTSSAADDKGLISAGTWVEYDVKPFIVGDGTYSFMLGTSSSDGVNMYSREASSLGPSLIVSFE
jgi:hypothetical protein